MKSLKQAVVFVNYIENYELKVKLPFVAYTILHTNYPNTVFPRADNFKDISIHCFLFKYYEILYETVFKNLSQNLGNQKWDHFF